MTDVKWVKVATAGSGFDADRMKADLESAGIPVLLRGHHLGMFGSGFQGLTPGGIDVCVPSPERERAETLLADDFST